jgi:hypothetical protein
MFSAMGGACRESGCACSICHITTSRSDCGYGIGRYNTASKMLKIVLFAAIPSASESTTTAINPGLFNKPRPAIRISPPKVSNNTGIFILSLPPQIPPPCPEFACRFCANPQLPPN